MAECGFHPSLAGEACGFCIVEGFGLGGERESLELLLRLLCSPYQHASHQELRMVLVAYVGPFCLELLCFQTDLLPVLTEICLVCLQIAQRDEGVLNVWRESCVQCLLRPLRLHEDKLPLLQLAVHALVDATRALELMLLSANEASCCAFVWQEMLELVLNEPEVGRHVLLLQAPPHVFSQGVRQRNADCSACFQLLVGELTGTEEVCREPDFAQFLCASVCPQVLVANTLVVLLLGSTTTTLGGDLECLVERMIGELQRAEAEAALALEALLHQQAVPTACAVALAHAITHMEHAEHRQRMYKALATSPSLLLDAVISEWSQGSVVLEADALALLLLSLGSEQRDLEALYQFVGAGGCQTQPVLSLVCEIARVKILAAPALFSLGLALVEGLGQQANAEYHELLCCLLERERDATVTSFAIALQQTGYLAVMLRNISALNLSRVKHLLQLVLGLIDFPFFLSLDHVNFALGADISRHAERVGSEASLCLVCALLWDVHLPSGTEGYAKALLPWTLDPAVPTSCLVYLLLLSSLRAYEVLVPNVQTRFRALSSEMQTYVATCLLRITRQRSLQVQSTGFALLLESGFRLNPLEFGWSGEELLGMLFEGGIGLELFAAVLELTDSDALISALRQQQHGTEWTTPSKLFLLTNTLLLRLAVGFTPDHLVVLDGLAAICLEHGVELDALPTANLPSSVAGVQLRASVLKTAPNQQHQEEPLSFQLAVMERLSTGQFSQGDLSWLLVCFQQHRLPQATWRKVLIKLLCGGGDHLEARVLAAEILETLCWEGGAGSVDHQRCFDKALELFAIHHQPCGLRLMIRISLASISTDKDEGYIGQGVYSLVASTANPSTLLVLLLLMNGGQRPLDGFVKQRLAELLLPSGTGNDLCLVLVLVLVLRRLQPEIQLMELARARLRRITAHSVAEDNAILSGDLHRAAESGWGLTNPLAELVLGLSLSPTANATAAPALARMLLESCRI